MSEQAAHKQETLKESARPHQPGEESFRAILPEDVEWKPFSGVHAGGTHGSSGWTALGARANMAGVKVPHGVKLTVRDALIYL